MSRLVEIDWSEIVLDLRRAGMTQNDIARATNGASGEAAIRSYLAGASPVHWRGETLLAVWMQQTGKLRTDAPMRIANPYHGASHRKRALTANNLPKLARVCGVSVAQLMRMMAAGRRSVAAKRKHQNASLLLPGFER